MEAYHNLGLGDIRSYLWLIAAVVLCLPVAIVVLRRIGHWWLSAEDVPDPAEGRPPPVPWPAWYGLLLFLAMFMLMIGLTSVYDRLAQAGFLPWEPLSIPEVFSPGIFLSQVLPPLAGLALLLRFGREGLATAGVRAGRFGPGVLNGLVAFGAILPVCVAALVATHVFMSVLRLSPEQHPLLETVKESPEGWVIPVAIVQAGVLAPLTEEFIYRGVLLMTLVKQMGILWALVVSSAVFAAVHMRTEPQAMAPLFFLGLALGYAAWRTRSLVAPIVCHALFNILMVLGTFASNNVDI
jgi:membrane protease YdiL (CAAX protease family)